MPYRWGGMAGGYLCGLLLISEINEQKKIESRKSKIESETAKQILKNPFNPSSKFIQSSESCSHQILRILLLSRYSEGEQSLNFLKDLVKEFLLLNPHSMATASRVKFSHSPWSNLATQYRIRC